jgi:hypothetical protein
MPQSIFARRAARRGRGVLPPNPKQWDHEHAAIELREELGLADSVALDVFDAFDLLTDVLVLPHGDIPAAAVHIAALRNSARGAWSGMSFELGDGLVAVVYNDSHTIHRVNATLTEEFFHIRLKHPRSNVRLFDSGTGHRSYDRKIEDEAFGCAAASLVPFRSLSEMIAEGKGVAGIASVFGVSQELVWFRAKVTRQYQKLRNR